MKNKLLLVLLISSVILTFNLGSWGVLETSEARYAEISREMLVSKDYLHPTLLNIRHYHKPPTTYFITVLGYRLFGINEFGARFFLQVAILLQMILIYHITLILYKKKDLALMATLIYFSLPLVLISSRNLTTDAYLNTFILAAIWAWLSYKTKPKASWHLYLFYLFLALGFETKGPVVLIFPLVFIIAYKVILKDKISKNKHHFFGLVLFFIVASLWYLLLYAENRNLLDYFLNKQLADRIATNSFKRAKPFWYYLAFIPLAALPWSAIIVYNVKTYVKNSLKTRSLKLVLTVTILVCLLIFSAFKTKLILYLLPIFGFIAIIAAKIVSESSKQQRRIYNNILLGLIAIFLITLMVINSFRTPIHFDFYTAAVLSLLTLICIILIYRFAKSIQKTAILGYVFGALLVIAGNYILTINQDELNSAKHALTYIEKNLETVENIAIYNYLIVSTPYYSQKPVFTLNNGHYTVERETQFEEQENWKKTLIDVRSEWGKHKADSLIDANTAILARKRDALPDYLKKAFNNKLRMKYFGKWVIYY